MAERVHERLYRALRLRIMNGELDPGAHLTLRGLASQHATSVMPVREAVRRLSAEGALTMTATGRIVAPDPAPDRIEELVSLRALLEPELAVRALPRIYPALVDRLAVINSGIGGAIATGDAIGYIRANLDFHRTIYLRARSPAMLAMLETVWLQIGPAMRRLYEHQNRSDLGQHHRTILTALQAGDAGLLRVAVRTDVTQGLRMLAS
jgi:DNA-binding GntR family transcriptional regulator